MKIIDLSVQIDEDLSCEPEFMMPKINRWSHEKGADNMLTFFPNISKDDLPNKKGWAIDFVNLCTHSGTHMDAPWHYHPLSEGKKAKTIDEIPLEWCIGNGVKLDFSNKSDGYLITKEDCKTKLKEIGYTIKQNDIVLIQSGAAKYWGEKEYINKGCGMSREATLYLVKQGVKITGTDAWSWDRPLSYIADDFNKIKDKSIIWEAHFAGIEKEYCHIEKMTNLDILPPIGFKIICFPIKIKGASAGWVRPIALIEN